MKKLFVIFIIILILCSIGFAEDKTEPAKKDTVIWMSKSEILRYLDEDDKQIDIRKSENSGQRKLLYLMPDSVQIVQKRK
jgi:hypothetical protein